MKKLNYFLRDWRNDEQTRMDPQLFDILWEITREVDTKEPVRIVSSYRSPQTNSMLRRRSRGVAKFSQHMLGKAIDFNISGVSVEQLRIAGLRLQRGGVGYYPGAFVHVDVGSVRHWPRMTHDQLARVFPNGRTVHLPSNSQPLSGYAQALADLEAPRLEPVRHLACRCAQFRGDRRRARRFRGEAEEGNILSKLFGFSTDSEEEEDDSAAYRRRRPGLPPPFAKSRRPPRRHVRPSIRNRRASRSLRRGPFPSPCRRATHRARPPN